MTEQSLNITAISGSCRELYMAAADRQRYRNARQETTSFGCRFFLFPGNESCAGKFRPTAGKYVVKDEFAEC